MKTILLLSIVALCSFSAMGQVVYQELSLTEAIEKSKATDNLVLVMASATWCGPCKYLEENVFPSKDVGDYLNSNVIFLKYELDLADPDDIMKRFSINAYPTFIFVDGEGKETGRFVGSSEKEVFLGIVRSFTDPTQTPDALKAVYDAEKTFDNAAAYMDALYNVGKLQEASVFFNEVFESFDSKFSEKFWKYASRSISSKDSEVRRFIEKEKKVYDERVGRAKVNESLLSAYKNIALSYISGRETLSNEAVDKLVTSMSLLNEKSQVIYFYTLIVNHYANDEMDKITNLFHIGAFANYATEMEQQEIERAFLNVKGMPKEKIKAYFEGKANWYKIRAESFEKRAESYQ